MTDYWNLPWPLSNLGNAPASDNTAVDGKKDLDQLLRTDSSSSSKLSMDIDADQIHAARSFSPSSSTTASPQGSPRRSPRVRSASNHSASNHSHSSHSSAAEDLAAFPRTLTSDLRDIYFSTLAVHASTKSRSSTGAGPSGSHAGNPAAQPSPGGCMTTSPLLSSLPSAHTSLVALMTPSIMHTGKAASGASAVATTTAAPSSGQRQLSGPLLMENTTLDNTPLSSLRSCSEFRKFSYNNSPSGSCSGSGHGSRAATSDEMNDYGYGSGDGSYDKESYMTILQQANDKLAREAYVAASLPTSSSSSTGNGSLTCRGNAGTAPGSGNSGSRGSKGDTGGTGRKPKGGIKRWFAGAFGLDWYQHEHKQVSSTAATATTSSSSNAATSAAAADYAGAGGALHGGAGGTGWTGGGALLEKKVSVGSRRVTFRDEEEGEDLNDELSFLVESLSGSITTSRNNSVRSRSTSRLDSTSSIGSMSGSGTGTDVDRKVASLTDLPDAWDKELSLSQQQQQQQALQLLMSGGSTAVVDYKLSSPHRSQILLQESRKESLAYIDYIFGTTSGAGRGSHASNQGKKGKMGKKSSKKSYRDEGIYSTGGVTASPLHDSITGYRTLEEEEAAPMEVELQDLDFSQYSYNGTANSIYHNHSGRTSSQVRVPPRYYSVGGLRYKSRTHFNSSRNFYSNYYSNGNGLFTGISNNYNHFQRINTATTTTSSGHGSAGSDRDGRGAGDADMDDNFFLYGNNNSNNSSSSNRQSSSNARPLMSMQYSARQSMGQGHSFTSFVPSKKSKSTDSLFEYFQQQLECKSSSGRHGAAGGGDGLNSINNSGLESPVDSENTSDHTSIWTTGGLLSTRSSFASRMSGSGLSANNSNSNLFDYYANADDGGDLHASGSDSLMDACQDEDIYSYHYGYGYNYGSGNYYDEESSADENDDMRWASRGAGASVLWGRKGQGLGNADAEADIWGLLGYQNPVTLTAATGTSAGTSVSGGGAANRYSRKHGRGDKRRGHLDMSRMKGTIGANLARAAGAGAGGDAGIGSGMNQAISLSGVAKDGELAPINEIGSPQHASASTASHEYANAATRAATLAQPRRAASSAAGAVIGAEGVGSEISSGIAATQHTEASPKTLMSSIQYSCKSILHTMYFVPKVVIFHFLRPTLLCSKWIVWFLVFHIVFRLLNPNWWRYKTVTVLRKSYNRVIKYSRDHFFDAEGGDADFYEMIRLQPFATGGYLRGLLVTGFSSLLFNIYSLVLWPDLSAAHVKTATAAAVAAAAGAAGHAGHAGIEATLFVPSHRSCLPVDGNLLCSYQDILEYTSAATASAASAATATAAVTASAAGAGQASIYNYRQIGSTLLSFPYHATSYISSSFLELLTPFSYNAVTCAESWLYTWLLLQLTVNIIQIIPRAILHVNCWKASRSVDVNEAISVLRWLLTSDMWAVNRLLCRTMDVCVVAVLLGLEVFSWVTPADDPLKPVVMSLCATNVLAILIRICISAAFALSMHDPTVLSEARRRGLTRWDIDLLATTVFTDRKEVTSKECSICLSTFDLGELVMTLPCDGKHSFHSQCIRQWLERQNSCPLCQTML